jgi:hypothetical protein
MTTTNEPQRPAIPYERQADPDNNRMCGAAALAMVYRSFGKDVTQREVWPKIAKLNRFGSLAANTHLMVQDALDRGFAALAIQAKHPLQALSLCRDNGIRAILNHRATEETPAGHYSVLVDINTEHVIYHDPYFGPSRRVSLVQLLELWQPRFANSEIVGNVLIAITDQFVALPPCQLCGTVIPPSVDCPKCHQPVPLQPASLLGCVGAGCAARLWNYLCCRSCDYTWAFSLEAPPPKASVAPGEESAHLTRAFTELDKFMALVLSSEAVAQNPEVRKQFDFINASKEKLMLAQSEGLIHGKALEARLAQFSQMCKQAEQAILKRKEEITKPAPPLDGNALGKALLEELGFLGQESIPAQPVLPLGGSGRDEERGQELILDGSQPLSTFPRDESTYMQRRRRG